MQNSIFGSHLGIDDISDDAFNSFESSDKGIIEMNDNNTNTNIKNKTTRKCKVQFYHVIIDENEFDEKIFVKSRSNPDLSTYYTSTWTVYAQSIIDHSLVKSKPSILVFKWQEPVEPGMFESLSQRCELE